MEKKKNFVISFLYYLFVGVILFVIFKYGIFWFMPFLFGFGIAFLLKSPINWIANKTRIKRRPVAAIVTLLFYGTVGVLITLLGIKLFAAIKDLFYQLPYIYNSSIEPAIVEMFTSIEEFFAKLDPNMVQELQDLAKNFTQSIDSLISNLSSGAISMISGLASSIPAFLLSVIFAIIATFFIAMDYYQITNFITRQFPDKVQEILFDVKDYVVGTIFKFIKAYGILMLITFLELSIGLSILRIENSVAIAAIIAVVDILPVLGTGGVVIPWVIIEFIKGNFPLAIGLAVVYVIITIVRNILEPKVVGEQVGLHPLVMLMCMFIGVKLFGFLGLFLLPLLVIILKNLNENGKIKLFK